MSEGVLPAAEVKCANERADEIWVPTKYHSQIFKRSGVSKPRLTVIPESVDVDFFDPNAEDLMAVACQPGSLLLLDGGGGGGGGGGSKTSSASDELSAPAAAAAGLSRGVYTGTLSNTPHCQRWLQPPPLWRKLPKARNGLAALLTSWRNVTANTGGMLPLDRHRESPPPDGGSGASGGSGSVTASVVPRRYVFLSVFKWEWRKGWDVLLNAYWGEFDRDDDQVVLRLRTFKPHWEAGHENIADWLKDAAAQRGTTVERLPPVEVVQRELSREELRWLYAASDAFVLPTRGEGWCLPAMEAMSMALPVILTNASGTTEYLTRKNSLPLGFTSTHADGKVRLLLLRLLLLRLLLLRLLLPLPPCFFYLLDWLPAS